MKVKLVLGAIVAIVVVLASCKKKETAVNPQDEMLQLNQIQIIASHNSYHKRDTQPVLDFLAALVASGNSSYGYDPQELDYNHIPIDQQMDGYPVRGLELDIFNDPEGGVFYTRKVNHFAHLNDTSFAPELLQPGFKILHIKDVDYNSTYNTLKQGLQAIKKWSDAHPNHLPIFVNLESNEESPADVNDILGAVGFKPAVKYDAAACDALDEEIKSVFGPNLDQVLTPDRVRNGLPKLNDVVRLHKWPKLGQCRGKVIFIMEGPALRDYATGHPSLMGRAVFTYANPGADEAAFLLMNDSKSQKADITARVREGYIVRSRADAGTIEARAGDYSSMDSSFASGAQITSTDYYKADDRAGTPGWTDFHVSFPHGELARKNIINADTINVDAALKE